MSISTGGENEREETTYNFGGKKFKISISATFLTSNRFFSISPRIKRLYVPIFNKKNCCNKKGERSENNVIKIHKMNIFITVHYFLLSLSFLWIYNKLKSQCASLKCIKAGKKINSHLRCYNNQYNDLEILTMWKLNFNFHFRANVI